MFEYHTIILTDIVIQGIPTLQLYYAHSPFTLQ